MFTFGFFSSINSLKIALVDANKSRLFGSLIEFRSFKIFGMPELFDLISLTNRLFNLLILFVVEFIPLDEHVIGFINTLEFKASYLTSINALVPIPTDF